MAEISKITLPSGNTYDIKDAVARSMISGGVEYNIAWAGNATPDVTKIPSGVVVTYNGTDYTGTLSPEGIDPGQFYLVKSSSDSGNSYDEYISVGAAGSKTWEKLGTKDVDLSGLGALAYKDTVSLSKGSGDQVLGESTTFAGQASAVSFSGGTTDTFVKSYPGSTSKLATTTVPNVTSAGSASTWNFALGTGNDSETLIISGGNGSAPTLGTAKTVATGSLSATGGGGTVMTGLGTATTASAVTGIGTGTAAGQSITVGTNDKVKVAVYDDLSVSAS